RSEVRIEEGIAHVGLNIVGRAVIFHSVWHDDRHVSVHISINRITPRQQRLNGRRINIATVTVLPLEAEGKPFKGEIINPVGCKVRVWVANYAIYAGVLIRTLAGDN